jgi:hypothetical protein
MTISVVQFVQGYETGSNSGTLTLGAGTTGGNCLVALAGINTSGIDYDLAGITLGGSADNWGSLLFRAGTDASDIAIWADPDCADGQTSVTVTGASDVSSLSVDLYEVSGLAPTLGGLLDRSAQHEVDGTGAAWTSTATATTTQSSEIAFGVLGGFNNAGSNPALTGPSSPWVNSSPMNPVTAVFFMSGYNILSSEASVTYNGTSNMTGANNYYAAVVATLFGAAPFTAPQSRIVLQAVNRAATY